VDPVQPARHSGAGLVEVRHRGGGELVADGGQEAVQPGCPLGENGGHGAGGHACAEHVGQQLRGPVHRQVLVHTQVAHQRPHPGPVAGRRADMVGERRGGRRPAGAAPPLGPMLGDPQASGGKSNTCRASTPTTLATVSSAPHRSGTCQATSSGSSTCARCAPGAPGCLPGRRSSARSSARRSTREGLRSPSEDGGMEEFEESLPSRRSSSATRARNVAIRRVCSALTARSSTMTAACTPTVASRSGSGEEITASTTTSRQARLPVGRTEQLPHKPQTVNSTRPRGRGDGVLNCYSGP
jgi:hypothetical protein